VAVDGAESGAGPSPYQAFQKARNELTATWLATQATVDALQHAIVQFEDLIHPRGRGLDTLRDVGRHGR
jgi:hypothetical protein